MARLSKKSKDQVPPDVQDLYARVGQQRGNVPNMFRIYAHRPEILKTMVAHMQAVTNTGTVPVKTKELVASLVSRLNSCEYWNRSHTAQAARLGATEEQLQDLVNFETGPFDEREKAALAWAKQLTLDAHGVDDTLFARLRQHYDEGEIVEISAMAGLFNYFNRVNDALLVEPTKPGEGLWRESRS
jgi:uncharacterized peroxidase-related enzyme